MKSRIFHLKCKKCGFEYESKGTRVLCPNCSEPNIKPVIHKHKCSNCGYYEENKTPVNFWSCPKCNTKSDLNIWKSLKNKKYNHICVGYEEKSKSPMNMWSCPKCKWRPDESILGVKFIHMVCQNCHYEEDSMCNNSTWECPKCGWLPDNSIRYYSPEYVTLKCKDCGLIYKSKSINMNCPKCGGNKTYNKYNHKCEQCGFTEINSCSNLLWHCPKCGWRPDNSLLGLGSINIEELNKYFSLDEIKNKYKLNYIFFNESESSIINNKDNSIALSNLIEINDSNCNKFDNICGVHFKCFNNSIIDVMATKNICNEYKKIKYWLDYPKKQ